MLIWKKTPKNSRGNLKIYIIYVYVETKMIGKHFSHELLQNIIEQLFNFFFWYQGISKVSSICLSAMNG